MGLHSIQTFLHHCHNSRGTGMMLPISHCGYQYILYGFAIV
jgi:hypothetical protein